MKKRVEEIPTRQKKKRRNIWRKKNLFWISLVVSLAIIISGGVVTGTYIHRQKITIHLLSEKILGLEEQLERAILTEPDFYYLSPKDGLMEALEYYDIKCPEIVYAQAVIESGGFKSGLSVKGGNLFGLYDSSKSRYYRFNHWSESVMAYRDKVQYRWNPEKEDYYQFLERIGYAEDPMYIKKLKNIVNNGGK